VLLLGGGPIPAEQLESELPVVPTYGMTETASAVATGSPAEPLPGVDVRISGRGEILVRGAMVAAEGWLPTGDRGRLDAQGRLHVEGRLGDLIITGGENVAPETVERTLESHPQVLEAGVVGLPDPQWGEAVTAFVVGEVEPAELVAHARERLAPHEVPKAIHAVATLPRNAAGKLLRRRLHLESPAQ
jgi:O-succinylbenzoic acid--CoA ligase